MTEQQRSELAKVLADKAHELSLIVPDGLSVRIERGRVTTRLKAEVREEPQLRVMPALVEA